MNALQKTQGAALAAPAAQNIQLSPFAAIDRQNLEFLAGMIKSAGLIPAENNVSGEMAFSRVMAKIVGGTAYGFDPIASQENLHIINGRITLSARGYSQLLKRDGRYYAEIETLTEELCVLVVHKKIDGEWRRIGKVEFSRADAKKAGLLEKQGSNWHKYPKDMLYARCIVRVVRRFAPEVLDNAVGSFDLNDTPPELDPQEFAGTEVFEDAPESAPEPEPTPDAEPQAAPTDDPFPAGVNFTVTKNGAVYEVVDVDTGELFSVSRNGHQIVCTCGVENCIHFDQVKRSARK